MKYEIIDKVSRFVKRFGMIMDPETMNKARDEAEEYDFRQISEDHYAVIHKAKMYVIIEREGQIGCSCEDMTFRKDGVCKHIITFCRLLSPVTKKIDKLDEVHLMNVCGWTGPELHPEIELGGPGAVIQESTTSAPKNSIPPDPDLDLGVNDPLPKPEKPVKGYAKCQYCKLGATRKDQKTADAWKEDHEAVCLKNPANKQLITPCRYCGMDITERSPEDLILAIEDHEAGCVKNPANDPKKFNDALIASERDMPKEQQTTALSTGREFPDEREFTNAKVAAHVKNRGGFYKNQKGDEIPDSAAMSLYALDTCRISTETILIEKNADQAKAIVRGHKGEVSVDASVILRFDVLKRREVLKMAKKYPKAILEWSEEMVPLLNLNFTLKDKTPMITLGEHMTNFAVDQEQFADRTAETLARRRVFDMLSGVDWREDVEVQAEDADAASMGSKKR